MKNSFFKIAVILAVALFVVLSCPASGVTLAWKPSISTNVIAYKIYAWTNSPDTNCFATNAVQVVTIGNVTNATLNQIVSANYTFAATAIDAAGVESQFSNFTYLQVPAPPTYLITVQSSTNLVVWSNTPVFFRLQINPQ
jgi:hypothetical protein